MADSAGSRRSKVAGETQTEHRAPITEAMRITVVIPTYRRINELECCLRALKEQTRKADEILVVVRDSDEGTKNFLEGVKSDYPHLHAFDVTKPGQVAALNRGLEAALGDIIAFTDDDAVPHYDWLELIEKHFQDDSNVGGVGGKDNVFIEGKALNHTMLHAPCSMPKVGIITWHGRIIGNHHLGEGETREVDHLKGSNMSFRKEAIRGIWFDTRLRGRGAQYRNDLAMCLAVKQRGWKLIYDPQILIDHHYAVRFEKDQRGNFDITAIEDAAFNEAYIFLKYLPLLKSIKCLGYSFFVGSLFTPGLAQFLRILLKKGKQARARFLAATRGRCMAWNLRQRAIHSGQSEKNFGNLSYAPCSMPHAKYRIAFLISHPIQYMSPLFRELSKQPQIDFKVYYCSDESIKGMRDIGFGREVKWDTPLLEGYRYEFISNNSLIPTIFKPPFGLINLGIIIKILKHKHDVIIIHGWHYVTHWLAIITALLSRIPIFLRSEQPLNQESLKPKWKIYIKKIILGLLFKRIKGFLAIGSENREFYKFYGAKEEKIFLTPYAVDNDSLITENEKVKIQGEKLRGILGISKEDLIILFVGKLINKKRPMDLLRAYERIKIENKALIFVGEGKLRNSLEEYVKTKDFKKIYFTGFKNQTELSEYYAMADIFVLPSGVGETWGLVVNEAMCFGLPVIVSDLVGCGKDLVRSGENGFIFEMGNIEKLKECLENLTSDSNLRKEMGTKSLERIKQWDYQFDVKGIMEALEVL